MASMLKIYLHNSNFVHFDLTRQFSTITITFENDSQN